MNDKVYKVVELTGTSPESSDQAVRGAIERANKTLKNLDWFEVAETRGHIADGRIAHWQVTVKLGFRIED
jgi:flavin-binding protein dodecin